MKPNILPLSNSPSILLRAPRLRMLIRMVRKLSGLRCKRMGRLTTVSRPWMSHGETDFPDKKGAGSGHADITSFRPGRLLCQDPRACGSGRRGPGGRVAHGDQPRECGRHAGTRTV